MLLVHIEIAGVMLYDTHGIGKQKKHFQLIFSDYSILNQQMKEIPYKSGN